MTDHAETTPLPEERNSAIPSNSAATLTAEADAASLALIKLAVFANAETTELVQSGVTMGGRPVGDWKITVEKMITELVSEQLEIPEKLVPEQMEPADAPRQESLFRESLFDDWPGAGDLRRPASAGPGHGES